MSFVSIFPAAWRLVCLVGRRLHPPLVSQVVEENDDKVEGGHQYASGDVVKGIHGISSMIFSYRWSWRWLLQGLVTGS